MKTDRQIPAIANPIIIDLMQGSTDIDHTKHTSEFTERLKQKLTEERFERACRRYQSEWGTFEEREFGAIFRQSP